MFGRSRWTPFEEMFTFQREVDRLFNQFWSDLPTRTSQWSPGASSSSAFQVRTSDDAWRIDVPLPGIDPQDVDLEVAGNNLSIRIKDSEGNETAGNRYEQTLTVPQFLDLERITASHHHGMLRLTVPLKESVKPRRVEIEAAADKKQLSAA